MAQVQITDVVVPAEFTAYQVENSMVSTALYQSGVALPNGEMQSQLQAGAQSSNLRGDRPTAVRSARRSSSKSAADPRSSRFPFLT